MLHVCMCVLFLCIYYSLDDIKNFVQLDNAPKTFTKIVFRRNGNYSEHVGITWYSDRQRTLNLQDLQSRKVIADHVFWFRELLWEIRVSPNMWVYKPCSLRFGDFNVYCKHCMSKCRRKIHNSLVCRVARWFQRIPFESSSAENSRSISEARSEKLDLLQILGNNNI